MKMYLEAIHKINCPQQSVGHLETPHAFDFCRVLNVSNRFWSCAGNICIRGLCVVVCVRDGGGGGQCPAFMSSKVV